MARPRLLVSWLWMASAGAWHVEDLRDALQRFLDDRAGPYAASLAVVGDGYEVAVAAGARPGDAFAFGSGTKPFVAAAVLKLVEAGVVGLDDAAGPWIDPALDALAPGATFGKLFGAAAAKVTLRMLLGMRSGVADFDVEAFDAEVLAAGDAVHAPDEFVAYGASKESELPNVKGSDLGRFPLVLADFWTSDHLSERSRRVDAFCGTRARGTLTLKRR